MALAATRRKPVVLLFYDETARVSRLQAAEFLPILVERRTAIDVVAIDVAAESRWSADERSLVRKYYGGSVPTTVVLGTRAPLLLLKYERIRGADLDAALVIDTRR